VRGNIELWEHESIGQTYPRPVVLIQYLITTRDSDLIAATVPLQKKYDSTVAMAFFIYRPFSPTSSRWECVSQSNVTATLWLVYIPFQYLRKGTCRTNYVIVVYKHPWPLLLRAARNCNI